MTQKIDILTFDCGAHLGYCHAIGNLKTKQISIKDSGFTYYDSKLPIGQRLNDYSLWIDQYISDYRSDIVVIEAINRVGTGLGAKKNENSWLLAYLYGELIRIASKYDIETFFINPISLKACVTGNARASKNEVIDAIRPYLPPETRTIRSDRADAVALAITYWKVYTGEYVIGGKKKKKSA